MLTDELKKKIQSSYSQFLESKSLKSRYGQKLMIAEIARTLGNIQLDDEEKRDSDGHVCVVEAGTGTGKTVAYMLPGIILAKAMGKKLVISTATIALQEQIVLKDLPDLKQHSGLEFSFSLAKGRGRYLCLSKLDRLLMDHESNLNPTQPLYQDEFMQVGEQSIKLYSSMMEALAANQWDGDRDNWEAGFEQEDWSRVTTDHRQCTGRRCSNVAACAFLKARENIGGTDVIVTNHDLVLADLALGGGAILPAPSDTIYIFDEGHHLPEKALNHFAHSSRINSTSKWLEQSNKILSAMLGEISGAGDIDRFAEQLPAAMQDCKKQLNIFYPLLQILAETIEPNDKVLRYRFEQGIVPQDLMLLAIELKRSFERLAELLGKISAEMDEAMEDAHCPVPKADLENWYPHIGTWQSRAEANLELWASYALPDNDTAIPKARWFSLIDSSGSIDFELCSSPILASNTLQYSLWSQCCGAVVTSATLSALGNFSRYQMRAGTPANSCYQMVPSPFDFSSAAILQVPLAAVEGGQAQAHTDAIIESIPNLLNKNEGSLVLFSSRRQMLDVYEALPGDWQDLILVQGDRSKQAILKQHKQRLDDDEGSILFGLASFAEGVDLPGKYCTHVVIAKIPFSVPDDPVEAALSDWIKARGGNPFMEISVPDAAIKLVQASGRLLRRETDTGTVTLMDRRIVTKRYGKAILNSLPPFKRCIY